MFRLMVINVLKYMRKLGYSLFIINHSALSVANGSGKSKMKSG